MHWGTHGKQPDDLSPITLILLVWGVGILAMGCASGFKKTVQTTRNSGISPRQNGIQRLEQFL